MPEQDAVQDGSGTQDASTDATQQEQEEFAFDKWLESQPETVRGGIDDHVHGLKSALENERTTRQTLEKRVRTLSKEAAEGSELKTELEKFGNELADANAKIDFFKEAAAARVTDLDLAWLAAKNAGLVNSKGVVDMRALREAHPALFAPAKTVVPPANGGQGRDQRMERAPSMNDTIRAMAGRN